MKLMRGVGLRHRGSSWENSENPEVQRREIRLRHRMQRRIKVVEIAELVPERIPDQAVGLPTFLSRSSLTTMSLR